MKSLTKQECISVTGAQNGATDSSKPTANKDPIPTPIKENLNMTFKEEKSNMDFNFNGNYKYNSTSDTGYGNASLGANYRKEDWEMKVNAGCDTNNNYNGSISATWSF